MAAGGCGSRPVSGRRSIIFVVKMLRGKSPNQPVAVIATCLALSVLLPQRIFQPADGWHTGHFHGPAVWLWLSCFGIVLLASIMLSESRELTSQTPEPQSRRP
jgi:hypothetical protein